MKDRRILNYKGYPAGIYVLEILHGGKKYAKKFFIKIDDLHGKKIG